MSKNLDRFEKELNAISKVVGKQPGEVTSAEFKNNSAMSDWELRKVGGFKAGQEALYPEFATSHISGLKLVKQHLNKIANKNAVDTYLKDEFLDAFPDALKEAKLKLHKAYKPKSKSKVKTRTIVAHVSDTHFGANIDASEMHDINEFNWEIAARRMALFAEQIVQYKPQHRKDTELVIAINGDIIAGMIHNQEWFSDLLTKQAAGTIKILTQFISYCAQYFDKVRVVMTTGNHGRAMHKSNKSRSTTHKWDSYETIIYLGVKSTLEAKHKNVTCEIPETPYAIVDIQGHKFFQTHGDTVINVGNPGRSINMKNINTQINTLNASQLANVKFAGILVGHVHVPTVQITDNGTVLLINGTLSGADPFVQSIGIFGNEPTQMMFEVTPEHAVGDIRFIRVSGADSNAELEKIIEPLKGNLE